MHRGGEFPGASGSARNTWLCPTDLSAGFDSLKEKGHVESNATFWKEMPKEPAVQKGTVGGSLEVISCIPPFPEEKVEAPVGR